MDDADDWEGNAVDEWQAEEWVSMIEAADAIAVSFRSGYIESKLNIIELISDSRLEMRCKQVREEADFGEISWKPFAKLNAYAKQKWRGFKFGSQGSKRPLPVKKGFFGRRDRWVIDTGRVDWEAGTIVATRPTEFLCQVKLGAEAAKTRRAGTGILIRRSSLPSIPQASPLEDSSKVKRGSSMQGAPGPRIRKFDDATLMASLKAQILDGSISQFGRPTVRGTQANLERHISLMMVDENGDEPSEKTVRTRAQEIMKVWREQLGL